MENKIHYSVESRRDVDEIWDHIAFDLQNTIAAENTVERIFDAVDQLKQFAESGAPLSSIADVESDYRFLVSGSYLIFYRVFDREVYVDRILYGRSNYMRIMLGDKQGSMPQ